MKYNWCTSYTELHLRVAGCVKFPWWTFSRYNDHGLISNAQPDYKLQWLNLLKHAQNKSTNYSHSLKTTTVGNVLVWIVFVELPRAVLTSCDRIVVTSSSWWETYLNMTVTALLIWIHTGKEPTVHMKQAQFVLKTYMAQNEIMNVWKCFKFVVLYRNMNNQFRITGRKKQEICNKLQNW